MPGNLAIFPKRQQGRMTYFAASPDTREVPQCPLHLPLPKSCMLTDPPETAQKK
jgi:hypothetical protein